MHFTPLWDKQKPVGTSPPRTQCNQCDFCLSQRTCAVTAVPHPSPARQALLAQQQGTVAHISCECSGVEPQGFSNLLINVLWPQDPFLFSGSWSPASATASHEPRQDWLRDPGPRYSVSEWLLIVSSWSWNSAGNGRTQIPQWWVWCNNEILNFEWKLQYIWIANSSNFDKLLPRDV